MAAMRDLELLRLANNRLRRLPEWLLAITLTLTLTLALALSLAWLELQRSSSGGESWSPG